MNRLWIAVTAAAMVMTLAGPANSATFEVGDRYIQISDVIELGDHDKFVKLLRMHGGSPIIILNGPGGLIYEALQIGLEIQERRLKTIASGECYSSCAYVWLAGARKGMGGDAVIGFHAAYNKVTGEMDAAATAVIGKYMSDLGVNYKLIIAALSGNKGIMYFKSDSLDAMAAQYDLYVFPIFSVSDATFFINMN